MYILYGGGFSRALAPQMVLEEAGLPYELRVVDLDGQEHRGAEFRKLNPAGYVPALITPEGDVLHEAAGIMLYLADRHGLDELAPLVSDPKRGIFLSKFLYFTNDIQPSLKRFYYAHRYALRKEDIANVRAQSRDMACERWQILEDWLTANGPFHLGERFSLADLHLAMWTAYGFETPGDMAEIFPATGRIFAHVKGRPKSGPLLTGLLDLMVARRERQRAATAQAAT
jgi:glutathione S-transferase